jgi:PAT family beta-lactamase induction signal transducer AmpG
MWTRTPVGRSAACAAMGFSSGLPLYVLIQMLPAWMRDQGVDLASVGLLSALSFPYTWKFLWAPLLDRGAPPGLGGLGRRRGWALLSQIALACGIAGFAGLDPAAGIGPIAALGATVALASATQDIALDAWRRELLPDAELGWGNSLFVNVYRLSSLVPGSLALVLADHLPWSTVHLVVAAFQLPWIAVTLSLPEPAGGALRGGLQESVVAPFRQFFQSRGTRKAALLLAFMLLYKLGDSMATALSTAFYLDLGFTKTVIGTTAKAAALWSSVAGGLVGGLIMLKIGIHRALWAFGAVQLVSILGFAALAVWGPDPTALFAVVSFEYLGVGLGTSAFVAFIARCTDPRYTATQLALLTSLTGVPRTLAGAATGYMVEAMGYPVFFVVCFCVAVPGLLILPWVAPWGDDPPQPGGP